MGKLFITAAVATACCALLFASSAFGGDRLRSSRVTEERAVRALISDWVEAYQTLDAKRLAAHETPSVEVVDRFGQLRLPSAASENEKLWSDTFEVISKTSTPPRATVDRIEFLQPEVALVQVSWHFSEGILLVDGDRIPPFSEIDTYVVTKVQGVWLVAALNMQEKKP
jgi:uncharacterized protein (TIGR02246 family)